MPCAGNLIQFVQNIAAVIKADSPYSAQRTCCPHLLFGKWMVIFPIPLKGLELFNVGYPYVGSDWILFGV